MAMTRLHQHGETPGALLGLLLLVVLCGAVAGWMFLRGGAQPAGDGSGAAAGPSSGAPDAATHPAHAEAEHHLAGDPGAEVSREALEERRTGGDARIPILEGTVRDAETGQPVPLFEVYLVSGAVADPLAAASDQRPYHARNPDGWFQVAADGPGPYHLVIRSGTHQDLLLSHPSVSGSEPLDLRLERGAWLTGEVLGPDGQARPDVSLWLVPQDAGGSEERARSIRGGSDKEGRFAFYKLVPGAYRLVAGSLEAPLAVADDLTVEEGLHLVRVLDLPPVTGIRVHLRGWDETPLAGARVTLLNDRNQVVRTTLTDDQGRCRISPVREGRHHLHISAAGYSDLEEEFLVVVSSEDLEIRRRLSR